MKTMRETEDLELAALKTRLAEAEETLRAIYDGEVDAVLVAKPGGDQIFTLRGAETPYRLLVEAINEGALTVLPDGTILYCNNRFGQMVNRPMEHITGAALQNFFPAGGQGKLQKLLKQAGCEGSKGDFPWQPDLALTLPWSFRCIL